MALKRLRDKKDTNEDKDTKEAKDNDAIDTPRKRSSSRLVELQNKRRKKAASSEEDALSSSEHSDSSFDDFVVSDTDEVEAPVSRPKQNTPSMLHKPCRQNNPARLESLLADIEHDPDNIRDTDTHGQTCLHVAALHSLECLKKIKSFFADPPFDSLPLLLTRDKSNLTALAHSILAGADIANISFLMSWMKQTNLSLPDLSRDPIEPNEDPLDDHHHTSTPNRDDSICFLAARTSRTDILRLCVSLFGIHPVCEGLSSRTEAGATPLHYASAAAFATRSKESVECVEWIVRMLQENDLQRVIEAKDWVQSKSGGGRCGGRSAALFAVGSEVPWLEEEEEEGVGEEEEEEETGTEDEEIDGDPEAGGMESMNGDAGIAPPATSTTTPQTATEDELWKQEQQRGANLLRVIECLLDAGISKLSTEQGSETSLLHLAALHGLELIVRLLLDRGVPPTLKDKLFWTPLIYAHLAEESDKISDGCLLALLEANPQQLGDLMQLVEGNAAGHEKVVKRLMRSLATKPRAHKFVNDFIRSQTHHHHPHLLSWFSAFPGLLDFPNKKTLLQHTLARLPRSPSQYSLLVHKDAELLSAWESLHEILSYPNARAPHISARFVDSVGVGPGVTREYWDSLSRDILSPRYAIFSPFGTNPSSTTTSTNPYFFCHDKLPPTPETGTTSLTLTRFAGHLVALALLSSHPLPALESLSTHVFRILVEDTISFTWRDFETLDAEVFKSWEWVLKCDARELEAAGMECGWDEVRPSSRVGEPPKVVTRAVVEGVSADAAVTVENRDRFVEGVVKRMVGVRRYKMVAFREGFHAFVPCKVVRGLTGVELELMVCGVPSVDVGEWKQVTVYERSGGVGWEKEQLLVQWFWEIVEGDMTTPDHVLLLKFATGCGRTPVGGFLGGGWKFRVALTGASSRNLPSASTCFNLIKVPNYVSKEVMREKIFLAVREGGSGFAFC
ncbi:E3 ubiquitin-protein ligase [Podochytrium sp. JEL0797]|nr:E3 ubiquitin-protein ligase [Podochytrium sp. JEL0797]